MRKSISLILIASLITASCGWRDSRVNPRNWFGNSRDVPVEVVDAEANPLIPIRKPASVTSYFLRIRKAPPEMFPSRKMLEPRHCRPCATRTQR